LLNFEAENTRPCALWKEYKELKLQTKFIEILRNY
jgi:hypothetical protein